jgi:hypothetical protein
VRIQQVAVLTVDFPDGPARVGLADGNPDDVAAQGVERVRVENRVPWPAEGPASFTVELESACLAIGTCGADEQCADGRCVATPSAGAFDGRVPVDEGVPCDAGEPQVEL